VQTYTVFEKRVPPEDIDERAGSLVFLKEGFSFWALVVPALWFLFNGLWRGLLIYLVVSIAAVAALSALGVSEQALGWAGILINVIFAFEARDMYRASLERRGYALIGVVSGRNLEECERRFLMEWLPEARRLSQPSALTTSGTPSPSGGAGASGSVPVIGMFPAHGG